MPCACRVRAVCVRAVCVPRGQGGASARGWLGMAYVSGALLCYVRQDCACGWLHVLPGSILLDKQDDLAA